MASVDMSLEDIISKNRKTGGGRGGRGGTRGNRPSSNRGRGSFRGSRGRGGFNTAFRSQRANINENWSHDMYYGGAGGAGGANVTRSVSTGTTKLNISNLEYGVSDSDIKELFSEFGAMRTAAVHYDRSGRSLGSAHVIFERRSDALQAIKQYNAVHLDGRPMSIAVDGDTSGISNGVASRTGGGGGGGGFNRNQGSDFNRPVKRLQGGSFRGAVGGRGRGGSRGTGTGRGFRGGRGSGRGGLGRGGNVKPPTSEELDAELDAYVVEGGNK